VIAIVTGASSGIGREIAIRLLGLDYKVYGIGRDFTTTNISHDNFTEIKLELQNITDIEKFAKDFLDKNSLDLLVNCAGFGLFKQLEDFNISQIDKMIDVNLKAPLILSNLFLKSLKKNSGTIVNIASIEATKNSRFSSIYSATKSGLRAFGLSLFEEVRKAGVRVVTLNPDITDTPFFDNLPFYPKNSVHTTLLPQQIANTIEFVLSDNNQVITELTIRAKKFELKKR
jgi:short-subunit dehydrogenase